MRTGKEVRMTVLSIERQRRIRDLNDAFRSTRVHTIMKAEEY
jgi:hypothetical protein